jgi:hypothetical protein
VTPDVPDLGPSWDEHNECLRSRRMFVSDAIYERDNLTAFVCAGDVVHIPRLQSVLSRTACPLLMDCHARASASAARATS